MYCTQCGTEAVVGGKFCAKCGAPIIAAPATQSHSESKVAEPIPRSPELPTAKRAPSGVGGWLLLLVAGLLVLGPLLGAGRISADFIGAEDQYPALRTLAQWQTHKTVTWWTFFLIVLVSTYAGWGLATGRTWSVVKRAMWSLWIAGPIGALVLGVAIPLATLGDSAAGDVRFVGGILASLTAAGIWTAYLAKSKRVRATYGANSTTRHFPNISTETSDDTLISVGPSRIHENAPSGALVARICNSCRSVNSEERTTCLRCGTPFPV